MHLQYLCYLSMPKLASGSTAARYKGLKWMEAVAIYSGGRKKVIMK